MIPGHPESGQDVDRFSTKSAELLLELEPVESVGKICKQELVIISHAVWDSKVQLPLNNHWAYTANSSAVGREDLVWQAHWNSGNSGHCWTAIIFHCHGQAFRAIGSSPFPWLIQV